MVKILDISGREEVAHVQFTLGTEKLMVELDVANFFSLLPEETGITYETKFRALRDFVNENEAKVQKIAYPLFRFGRREARQSGSTLQASNQCWVETICVKKENDTLYLWNCVEPRYDSKTIKYRHDDTIPLKGFKEFELTKKMYLTVYATLRLTGFPGPTLRRRREKKLRRQKMRQRREKKKRKLLKKCINSEYKAPVSKH